MDVRCEQCGTIYEFDDMRVISTGITVKCTTCNHIFKVFPKPSQPPPQAASDAAAGQAAPAKGATSTEEDKRWLIRKPSGEIFKFRELTTLQQWIVEQKVSREDEISRTGKVWERLGAIKELEPFFCVVDKARASEDQSKAKTLLAAEAAPKMPSPGPAASTAPAQTAKATRLGLGAGPVPMSTAALSRAPTPLAPFAAPGLRPGTPSSTPPSVTPGPRPAAPSSPPMSRAAGPKPPPMAPAPPVPVSAETGVVPGAPAKAQGVSVSEPYRMGAPAADMQGPAFEAGGLELDQEPAGRRAAWEGRHTPRRERDDPTDLVTLDDSLPPSRGSGWVRMALVILLGTAVGFGAFAAWSQWDRIKTIFSGTRSPNEGAYYKSRTLFRMDTEASYRQALEHLDRILSPTRKVPSAREKANALATQAEIYAAWAQYLRDDAEDLARQALAMESRSAAPHRGAEPGALRRQAAEREEQARDKAGKALQSAQTAHRLEVSLKTKRALAEASRVAKEPTEVVNGLVNDALTLGSSDAELHYSYAMLAYDRSEWDLALGRLRKAIELSDQKIGKPFFRAQLRLARVYLIRGKKSEARAVLEAITERNPGHIRAAMLLERLREEAKAPVVTPATVDAGVPSKAADAGPGMESDPRRPGAPGEVEVDGDYESLVRRAEKLSFAGQPGPAIALYQRALVKRPSGVEALTGLGYAHLDQRRMGEALAHFRKALSVSANYGEALIGMAEASQRSGNLRQALQYYQTYLQSHPSGRRAVLAKTNIKELEEKVGTPAERPGPDPGSEGPRGTEPPPAMDPERPVPRVTEPPPAMDPERPAPMVAEPPPAMDPERPAPRVTEPPPAMDPERPAPRVAEPPPATPPGGM